MESKSKLPHNFIIINPKNYGFIDGSNRKLGGASTARYLVKFIALFYFTLALPIAVLIALVFSLLGQGAFLDFLLFEAIFMILISCYMAYMGYKTRHTLETKGEVLSGEVTGYDSRQSLSISGYKTVPRLKYGFISPSGVSLSGSTLIPAKYKSHLPDGQELPAVGTAVAILYADDKKHTIL
ncbi:MAG: hypothetical protein GC179_08095 [Anaerolineaceae bacterium]|nr:hypothetical protein [Anaerolineaceae bacterium]